MIETKRLLLREFMEICCKSNKKALRESAEGFVIIEF